MNNLLAEININTLVTVVAIVAVLAVVFALLILLVYKFTEVKGDEKTDKIKDLLSNANCGGCGYAGCAEFAKAVAEGRAEVSACGPTSKENKAKIAAILGVEMSDDGEKRAVIHCNGGENCITKFNYVGNNGCLALSTSAGGGNKACAFGCLGEGDCRAKCDYNAIKIINGVAVTDGAKCSACGKCVKACPKKLAGLVPKKAQVYIACSSLCRGKDVMSACKKGCIGCGLCEKNCPQKAITMVNNLPVIDYSKCVGCKTCADKCPRKCILEP